MPENHLPVLDGELRVRMLVGVVDRVDKTLCKLGRGEFFGELGMFLRSKRTADVIAETQSWVVARPGSVGQLLAPAPGGPPNDPLTPS